MGLMSVCPIRSALLASALFVQAGAACAQAQDLLPTGANDHFRQAPSLPAEVAVALPAAPRTQSARVVALPRLSSSFGARRDPLGPGFRAHHGIDIPASRGTPVRAAGAGQVRLAAPRGGYGLLVEIVHGYGLATRYAHLARILVSPGQEVRQGDTIGLVGSTGRSTGSHLHFEVRRNSVALDPIPFLGASQPIARLEPAPLLPAGVHVSRFARARNARDALPGDGF